MVSTGRDRQKCQDVIELFTCFNMHFTSKKLWGLDQQDLVFTLGNSLFSDAHSLICLWFPLESFGVCVFLPVLALWYPH